MVEAGYKMAGNPLEGIMDLIPIDARVIALDETEYWHIEPELMKHVERIEGVYVYDKNSVTYCCEITPSYWLEPVEQRAIFKDGTPDAIIDKVDNIIVMESQDGKYVHTYQLDSLAEKLAKEKFRYYVYGDPGVPFEDVSREQQIESLVENFRCNTVI